MVTIEKDGKSLEVTLGAYNGIYRRLGYTVAGLTRPPTAPGPRSKGKHTPEDGDPLDGLTEVDDSFDDLAEKPISEMTFKEIKAYAASLGINTNGMSSRKEIKKAIMAIV